MEIQVLDVRLETEEVKIRTSDSKAFRKYLDDGFSVFDRNEGTCILKRGSHVWVTIEHNGKCSTIDLKKSLSLYYKKSDNTKAYHFFKKDLEKDKIKLILNPNGYYTLVEK